MSKRVAVQHVLGIGMTWGFLWLLVMLAIGLVIWIVDPDSIDPGETQIAIMVLGSMGLLSGVAFALLVSLREGGTAVFDLSLSRAGFCGILGSAVVQLGYLNHGDAGLTANLGMALVFCAFGGVIAVAWLFIARRWFYWRSSLLSRQ